MDMLNRFNKRTTLCGCALLLCFSIAAHADEVQDINKLFKHGQHEKALERVNTYLMGKPKDAQARFLKGLILTEQGKSGDAIRTFTELTEDYPELPEPYNNLAVLYAGQGQYDKAKVALEMAIRTHPSYATAHENLGDIYAKMASQAYDRALQLDRSNTSTKTKLALIKDLFTASAAKEGKAGAATGETKPQLAVAVIPAETRAAPPAAQPAPKPHEDVTAAAHGDAPVAAGHAGAASTNKQVLKAVEEWAAAWSSKNVNGYLAFYAEDFKTPDGESRSDWEAKRNERISRPKSIHVAIGEPKVKMIDDSHASVSFRQAYRASHLKTTSNKTLLLVKSGDNWLIQEERSGK